MKYDNKPSLSMISLFGGILLTLLFTLGVASQQLSNADSWQTYSPTGSLFTLEVPGVPLPPQGHIFDPNDANDAFKMFDRGKESKIYNFEIHKGDQRQFLVSILELHTAKSRSIASLTQKEVELINQAIGDKITISKLTRNKSEKGETVSWHYVRGGSAHEKGDEDGIVVAKCVGRSIVVVVVDYDFAMAEDANVKKMIETLSVR